MRHRAISTAFVALGILSACAPEEPPTTYPPAPPVTHMAPDVADQVTNLHAAAIAEDTGPAWQQYGCMLFRAGEMAEAETALLRAAEREGTDRAACLHAAGVATDGLDRARAARHFQASLDAGSPAATTRLRLGGLLEQLGRPDEAQAQYDAAMKIEVSSHALLGLGRVALARGDTNKALDHLNRARLVDDRHPEVLIALAQAYRRSGDAKRAQQFADAVGAMHQVTPIRDGYLGELLMRDGGR